MEYYHTPTISTRPIHLPWLTPNSPTTTMLKGKLKLPLPVPDKARRAFPDRLGSLVAGFDGKEEEYCGGSDLVVFEPGEELETFQPNGFVSDKESDGVENFVEESDIKVRPRPEKDGAGPVSTVQVIAVDEKRSDLEYEVWNLSLTGFCFWIFFTIILNFLYCDCSLSFCMCVCVF